ncbi:DUF1284 domain-containing protein [Methanobacterium sp. ACI-7]|uniref:DUF1284 domain-containing protein n=1 Tax=unclassified Methanobacterium TaxID=2627676 RepID=UPI0039C3BB91
MIKIRAHHLLCMQGFQGHGYSEDFNKNMSRIIENFKNNPEQRIKILTECDAICIACPHNVNEKCIKDSDSYVTIKNMDLSVLHICKIIENSVFKVSEIFDIVNKRIKYITEAEKICGNCKWKNVCIWFKKLQK